MVQTAGGDRPPSIDSHEKHAVPREQRAKSVSSGSQSHGHGDVNASADAALVEQPLRRRGGGTVSYRMYLSSMSCWNPRRLSGSNLPDSLLLFSSCQWQRRVAGPESNSEATHPRLMLVRLVAVSG